MTVSNIIRVEKCNDYSIGVETSRKISLLSFVCALFVVWLHTCIEPARGLTFDWFACAILKRCVVIAAVPFFFVVSGFLLAGKFDEYGWWGRESRKRVRSLIYPFLWWNLIAIVVNDFLLPVPANLMAHRVLFHGTIFENFAWLNVPCCLLCEHPYNGNTWYLRCLFIFVLLAPLFKWSVCRCGLVFLAASFCIYAFFAPDGISRTFWPLGDPWNYLLWGVFSLQGVFYFSVGIWLRRHRVKMHKIVPVVAAGMWVSLTGLFMFFCVNDGAVKECLPIVVLAIPCLLVVLWEWTPPLELPKFLQGSSFPIYLMHHPMIFVAGILVKRLAGRGVTGLVLSIVNFGLVMSLTLGALCVLRKMFPRGGKVIFGGRF